MSRLVLGVVVVTTLLVAPVFGQGLETDTGYVEPGVIQKYAQTPSAASSIEGVWKIAEIATTGANASTNDNPWPSLVIFTKKHYSFVSVNGTRPRPTFSAFKTPGSPTDAEKIARYDQWRRFTADSGTYDLKGTTLGMRALVAQSEGAMDFRVVHEFELEGDTLWLIRKFGRPIRERRTKLTRLE